MMFAGIREALRTPLARPPGRRSWFVRLGPAWWAAAVYSVFAVTFLWSVDLLPGNPLVAGLLAAWPLAGVIMLLGATISGVMALAPEHSRGTMDALLMTPQDHARLVRGRYWYGLAPWLRFFAYTLPLYVLLAGSRVFTEVSNEHGKEFWAISSVCAFSNKGILVLGLAETSLDDGGMEWNPWNVAIMMGRVANDLAVLVLAFTVAFFISARTRSTGRALALTGVIVPVALIFILAPHDLLLGGFLTIQAIGSRGSPDDWFLTGFIVLGVGTFLASWPLAWWLHRSACRNFERWATRGG